MLLQEITNVFFLAFLIPIIHCQDAAAVAPTDSTYASVPSCLVLYAGSVSLTGAGNLPIVLTPSPVISGGTCLPKPSVTLTYSGPSPVKTLKLDLTFAPSPAGYSWHMESVTASLTCVGGAQPSSCIDITTPVAVNLTSWWTTSVRKGSSLKCTQPSSLILSPDGGKTGTHLLFKSFQVQAFDIAQPGVFSSDVYDCTGYFTIPILSSLVVGFLFLAILSYGLSMLSSIKSYNFSKDAKVNSVQLGGDR